MTDESWPRYSVILGQHDRQDWLSGVTGPDVGNDLDGFCPAWCHQKRDFEVRSVGPFAGPGSDHRQCQEIMEPASRALTLRF